MIDRYQTKIHELKIWPEHYEKVVKKLKQFEIRKNDRNFVIGDTIILREWDPNTEAYTGNRADATVDYILYGGNFGIEEGYCVMSITLTGTRKVYK